MKWTRGWRPIWHPVWRRPTKEEHLVARLSLLPDRSEDEASIAAALNEALRWGRPMEGAKLQHERAAVLQGLGSAGDIDKWDAQDLLARLYCSHTYRETGRWQTRNATCPQPCCR